MLIPGYVTDGIGLLLFIPGFRTMAGISVAVGCQKTAFGGLQILAAALQREKMASSIHLDLANGLVNKIF